MPSLKFYLRPSLYPDRAGGRLCFRIIHNRVSKTISSPYRLFEQEWDFLNQQLHPFDESNARCEYLCQVEAYLVSCQHQFTTITSKLEKSGTYTIDHIVSLFSQRGDKRMLSGYGEKQASQLMRAGQERTARAYRTVVNALIRFNKGKDLALQHINASLIKSFERSMRDRGLSPNTISFYMRNLRAIYNRAIDEELISEKKEKPFAEVYTGVSTSKKRALTIQEMTAMHELDFSELFTKNATQTKASQDTEKKKSKQTEQLTDTTADKVQKGLYDAWRIFLFCFHTRGMSFVDVAYLRKDNIRGKLLSYYRKKTGQLIEIKITETMQGFIDSFAEEVIDSIYLFPIISDKNKSARLQYETGLRIQNQRLKILAKQAGIDKILSTHVSRHSWASIAKIENLPLAVISESLGHSDQKITYTYLTSFDQSILDNANDVICAAIQRTLGSLTCACCVR